MKPKPTPKFPCKNSLSLSVPYSIFISLSLSHLPFNPLLNYFNYTFFFLLVFRSYNMKGKVTGRIKASEQVKKMNGGQIVELVVI